jgi:hypothetical protein
MRCGGVAATATATCGKRGAAEASFATPLPLGASTANAVNEATTRRNTP